MNNEPIVTADFPYKSHAIEVLGSQIHYWDEGEGDPVVFLHGIPTSSYLWRKIIPHLKSQARCIAPDLIGMGQSDKPDIPYRIFDYIRYMTAFIEKLNLKRITFVMHAWGSVIGFDYAMRHESHMKGLAFVEAHIRPVMRPDMLSLPVQEMADLIRRVGRETVVNTDFYIDKVLTSGCMRRLTEKELQIYKAPFDTPASRHLLWQYFNDLPLGDGPDDVIELIAHYANGLQHSSLPKLMFYNVPGFITTMETVIWAKAHLPNLTLVEIEDALHYPQEYEPEKIGAALSTWYQSLAREAVPEMV